jgi:large subunit ribosomal protein L11
LGQAGVNIGEFVNQFNAATQEQAGNKLSVIINVYDDRSFDFILKTSPVAGLILKAAGIKSGSGRPNTKKAGKITDAQLTEIAEVKMPDLNAHDIDSAKKIVLGTCRSMGIEVTN